jgi:anthranilate/para-aminobenzoate synthase component I
LLDGDEATLFAGCGIVADSDPDLEFAESRWKLRPLISALSHASRRPDGLAADPSSDRDHSFGG